MNEEDEFYSGLNFQHRLGKNITVIFDPDFVPPVQTEKEKDRIKKILDSGVTYHGCYNSESGRMITYMPN